MQKVCLVIIDSINFNHANAFQHALSQLKVDTEIVRIPYFTLGELTPERLKQIRNILKEKSVDRFLMFCPETAEYFFEEVDQLFVFSAYRPWHNEKKVRVIPHVWTHIKSPDPISLAWADKPPLRVGFMGTSYSDSRLANIVSRLPGFLKEWFLRGSYLKHIAVLARCNQLGIPLKHLNTFARMETLEIMNSKKNDYKEMEVEIIDTKVFNRTEHEKNRYISHLERMTYIVCPRGVENFSIRVYEALRFGRIPVIIDTEMVLPKEIDWDRVSIRVPYQSLDKIYDIILRDYNSRSRDYFVERQQMAFSTMIELESMHWLTDLLRHVIPNSEAFG